MKTYEIREKIFHMSLERRILEAFLAFPNNFNYVNMLISSIIGVRAKQEIRLPVYYGDVLQIKLIFGEVGLTKYFEKNKIPLPYSFCFDPNLGANITDEEIQIRKLFSENVDKEDSDTICRAVIPFLVSRKKINLPLLVNIFSEFAKHALSMGK